MKNSQPRSLQEAFGPCNIDAPIKWDSLNLHGRVWTDHVEFDGKEYPTVFVQTMKDGPVHIIFHHFPDVPSAVHHGGSDKPTPKGILRCAQLQLGMLSPEDHTQSHS